MASILPLLHDHDIAVYRFTEPGTLDAEAYYATRVQRDQYFQGHYLKSVEVEKRTEALDVGTGLVLGPHRTIPCEPHQLPHGARNRRQPHHLGVGRTTSSRSVPLRWKRPWQASCEEGTHRRCRQISSSG